MNTNFGNTTTTGTTQINYQGKEVEVTEDNFRVFWVRGINSITMIKDY
jgi:archaellum biogenesis protein FlaJ (TadC family)